jgi:hypothetical protein
VSNALRGSAFEFYRDKELNATNAINELNNQPKSPYHYHQFGGTIGGPLRRNRDFFFAGYDGQRNRLPNLVVMNLPPELPGDAATAAGLERLRPLAASWSRSLDQDVFLMKTDHQVDADHRLSVRYNHQDFTGEGYEAFGPVQSLEHSGDSIVRTRTLNVSWAAAMRNGLFNEVRVQYARDHEPGTANSDNPEANVQQGATVLFIGRNNFSPRENAIDRVQVADTLTWMRGAHMVKTGFDIQIDRIRNSFPAFYRGSYLFLSLASFSRLRPDGPGESYQQSFPGPGTSGPDTQPDLREYSLFVQDEWKIRPDFTLNLGLRYDLMRMADLPVRNPDPQLAAAGIDTSRFPADVDNLGPRLGLAWSPRRHTYVVRGGWGLFYGRTPAVMANSAALNNGVNTVSLTFTGQAVPTYPQWFTEIPTGAAAARPTIVYVDEAFANPRLMHGNVAFEWQVADRASLAVTYVHVNGSDLPRSVDRNIGAPGVRTLTIGGTGEVATVQFFADATRPFSSFRRVIAFESNAESRYNGITLELASRQTGSTQYRVAYTFGKVEDTVPDASAVLPNNQGDDAKFTSSPLDFEVDRAAGDNDQRHRFVASGVFATSDLAAGLGPVGRALAGSWWLSGIVTAQSGRPYSARINGDVNGDGNTRNDLAPGIRRNALRLPSLAIVDLRLARDVNFGPRVRSQLICEVFNVFNRDNIIAVTPAAYVLSGTSLTPVANFRRPMLSAGERIMQLAVRISF